MSLNNVSQPKESGLTTTSKTAAAKASKNRYHGTATQKAFRAMSNSWLTGEQARVKFGIQTLGQRVSDWSRDGHEFDKKWVKSAIGSRCLAYKRKRKQKAAE